jgi:BirA family biotin operon repressor/biotin-[acetyl-CoA-carboxylase] ligase
MPAGSGKNIDQPWTDMCSETNARINRNDVVACLINTIVSYLEEFRSFGFDAFWESWDEIDFLKNKKGVVSTKDGELLAKFNGVTDQGALKIITDTGDARILHSGEVSVRVK